MPKEDWLTGQQVIEKLQLMPFEFLELVESGLVPHDPETGEPLSPPLSISQIEKEIEFKFAQNAVADLKKQIANRPRLEKARVLASPQGRSDLSGGTNRPPERDLQEELRQAETRLQELLSGIDNPGETDWCDLTYLSSEGRTSLVESLKNAIFTAQDFTEAAKAEEPDDRESDADKIRARLSRVEILGDFGLQKKGGGWEVRFAGKGSFLKDYKGMKYIAELLKRPNEEIKLCDIVPYGEYDGQDETVRKRVAKNVKDAIAGIEKIKNLKPLADHLKKHLKTGYYLIYCPPSEKAPPWDILMD